MARRAAVFAGASQIAPMRWFLAQPSSLELLDGSPVDALLLSPREISGGAFRRRGAEAQRKPGWDSRLPAALYKARTITSHP